MEPPFKPKVDSDTDIGNFDASFTSEPAVLTPPAPSDLVSSAICCSLRRDLWSDSSCLMFYVALLALLVFISNFMPL